MKTSAILFAAAATFAAAQDPAAAAAELPSCALACGLKAITASGCAQTDFKCICTNKSAVETTSQCILSSCEAADQASTSL